MLTPSATTNTTPAAPCIATGRDRIFSGACRQCPAFAIGCFPARSGGTVDDRELAPIVPPADLQAMQRNCAGSPCLATGVARTFSGACRSCPAFALWCFPTRSAAVA